jgi:hypothetical protein
VLNELAKKEKKIKWNQIKRQKTEKLKEIKNTPELEEIVIVPKTVLQ